MLIEILSGKLELGSTDRKWNWLWYCKSDQLCLSLEVVIGKINGLPFTHFLPICLPSTNCKLISTDKKSSVVNFCWRKRESVLVFFRLVSITPSGRGRSAFAAL